MAAKKKEVVAEAEGEEAPVKRGRGRPKGSTKSKGRGRPKGTNLKHFFLFYAANQGNLLGGVQENR